MSKAIHFPKNATIGNTPDVLEDIHLKHKNIAIYQRDIEYLNTELVAISKADISFKTSGSVAEIITTLKIYANKQVPNYPLFVQDIFELLKLFQTISKAHTFQLLLESVSTDMCTKFHADYNQLRLLCTYLGPGTLWLPNDVQKDNILIENIQQVKTSDVAILKGKYYLNAEPVYHRSPEIEKQKEKRLLLRIDMN